MKKITSPILHIIRFVVKYPVLVLLVALITTAAGLYLASKLEIDSDYSKLIPEYYDSVQALERVRDRVGGEGSDVAVGIISPSFEASKAFADALIPRAMQMTRQGETSPYLGSVEYQRETEFLKNNALFFATNDELEMLSRYLEDEIEKQSLEANPFFFDLGLDEDEEVADSLHDADIEEFTDLYDWLVGKEYPTHPDGTSMTLRFFPSGSQTNIRYIRDLYGDMEALIAEMDPKSFHPDMEIVLAGRLLHRVVQVEAIRNDVAKTFGLGAGAVLTLVLLYFMYKSYTAQVGRHFNARQLLIEIVRLPVLAIIIGLPLVMFLGWTFGTAYLWVGNLNLMTSTLALLLFGLGIDFGVHFYGRYAEERSRHDNYTDAMVVTFMSTGKAAMIGAATTATSFFMLTIADFRGFSEFGFIAGTGIVYAVIAMIMVQPAILVILERVGLLNLQSVHKFKEESIETGKRFPFARTIVAVSAVLFVVTLITLPYTEFEYNFNNLDPKYPEYAAKKAIVDGASSSRLGSNPAYVVADSQEEAVEIAEVLRQRVDADTSIVTIKDIITLQDRFPLTELTVDDRLSRIAGIRELLGNAFLSADSSDNMLKLRAAAQTTEPIKLDDVPDYLRNLFTDKTGQVGTFVIIYPEGSLSDGRYSMQFARDIADITLADGSVHHAGSTSLVAADMLRLMIEESPLMVTLVFLFVIGIMLYYFRSWKWALLALTPLIAGITLMITIMTLMGHKLNFFNLVVLPSMVGIGNDDGIHLTHRYEELGKGSVMEVMRTTGEQCFITSLTTMIGFLGLMFSFHPGLRSIGELALIGMITLLYTAFLLLPALKQVLEDRNRL
jgi:predicted RND superfamily exporter protein